MTKDIMKMDDRELYERVVAWTYGYNPTATVTQSLTDVCTKNMDHALGLCYKAEEKLSELGLKAKRAENLCKILNIEIASQVELEHVADDVTLLGFDVIADVSSAHPRPRVQAILLTIQEK